MNLSTFPKSITLDDEKRLFALLQSPEGLVSHDRCREEIILGTMREAFTYAKHFARRGNLEDGEVVSRVYEALSKSVKNFKLGRCRFFAYSKPYVRGAICSSISADHLVPKLTRVNPCDPHKEMEESRETCGRTSQVIDDGLGLFGSCEIDMESLSWRLLWEKVEPLLPRLTAKEQEVIADFRAGLNFPEMGAKRGVSRAAMQSTFSRAVSKLRGMLTHE